MEEKDFSRKIELFSTPISIDNILNLIQQSTENKKRKSTEPTKSFHDLTAGQKRYKTDENVEYLRKAASQNSLSIIEFLGYLLDRCNYNEDQNNGSNRQLAFAGKILFENGTLTIVPKLSLDEIIAIQTQLDLSRCDIRFLKAILEDKVELPNTNDILEYKIQLRPALTECRDGR